MDLAKYVYLPPDRMPQGFLEALGPLFCEESIDPKQTLGQLREYLERLLYHLAVL